MEKTDLKLQTMWNPNAMIRICEIPVPNDNSKDKLELTSIVNKIKAEEENLRNLASSFINLIENTIAHVQNNDQRNKLINLKRNIFNERWNKVTNKGNLNLFTLETYESANEKLIKIETFLNKINEMNETFLTLYEKLISIERQGFKRGINNPKFLNGILHTNRNLYQNTINYIKKDEENLRTKDKKLEKRLLNYYMRANRKTSPFSSFTSLAFADINEKATNLKEIINNEPKSIIKINHSIVLRLFNGFISNENVKKYIPFYINKTMVKNTNTIQFKQIFDKPEVTPTVYNRFEKNIKLNYSQLIEKIIRKYDGKSIDYIECANWLEAEEDISSKLAKNTLDKLIEIQLLKPDVQIEEQSENIIEDVISLLNKLPNVTSINKFSDFFTYLLISLKDLNKLQNNNENHNFVEIKKTLLKEIELEITNIMKEYSIDLEINKIGPIVYEDTYHYSKKNRLNISELSELKDNLSLWLYFSKIFDNNFRFQSLAGELFVSEFGEDGICENVDNFFKMVEPLVANGSSEFWEQNNSNKANQKEVEQLDFLKEKFQKQIIKQISEKKDISLNKEMLTDYINQIPNPILNRITSYSPFLQWDQENNIFVINKLYQGYSLFFSRFINEPFAEKYYINQKAFLKELFNNQPLIEYPSTMGFNANLHKELTDFSIEFKDLPIGRKNSNLIKEEEIQIRYNKLEKRVELFHPKYGNLNYLYHGFLTPLALPLKLNILSQLTNCSNQDLSFTVWNEMELSDESKQNIRYYPRIQLGNLLLSRRKWVVPNRIVPSSDSDQNFYYLLTEWVNKNSFPTSAFIRFFPENYKEYMQDLLDSGKEIDFNKFKPIYVDFTSPLSVIMFKKHLMDQDFGLIIEEAYPDVSNMLPEFEPNNVIEIMLELSQKESTNNYNSKSL